MVTRRDRVTRSGPELENAEDDARLLRIWDAVAAVGAARKCIVRPPVLSLYLSLAEERLVAALAAASREMRAQGR